MGADKEEYDGNTKQELLGWRILITIVDLLPHVEVVIGAGIELERDAPHPMEHEERAKHIADVGQSPWGFLWDTRDDIVEDLESSDADEVDSPRSCSKNSFRVSLLIASIFFVHGVRSVDGEEI